MRSWGAAGGRKGRARKVDRSTLSATFSVASGVAIASWKRMSCTVFCAAHRQGGHNKYTWPVDVSWGRRLRKSGPAPGGGGRKEGEGAGGGYRLLCSGEAWPWGTSQGGRAPRVAGPPRLALPQLFARVRIIGPCLGHLPGPQAVSKLDAVLEGRRTPAGRRWWCVPGGQPRRRQANVTEPRRGPAAERPALGAARLSDPTLSRFTGTPVDARARGERGGTCLKSRSASLYLRRQKYASARLRRRRRSRGQETARSETACAAVGRAPMCMQQQYGERTVRAGVRRPGARL